MSLVDLYAGILIPIGLGTFAKHIKLFSESDFNVLKKFSIKIAVPFLIFKNLYMAKSDDLAQGSYIVVAFFVMSILTLLYTIFLLKSFYRKSDDNVKNAIALGTFTGNYGYLGWGIIESLYGKQGFTLSVFFNIFFWPMFLTCGFILVGILSRGSDKKVNVVRLIISNMSIPFSSALLGLGLNLTGVNLPSYLIVGISRIEPLAVPLILFTIGGMISYSSKEFETVKKIWHTLFLRIIFGAVIGFLTVFIVNVFFPLSSLAKQIIFIESVMPTAVMSVFFVDYLPTDTKTLTAILTGSTILSILTTPLWFYIGGIVW